MSGGTALAVVMSISAGFAGSVQAAALGRLGDRVGTVEAVGFSTLVAGATGILVLLVARRSLAGVLRDKVTRWPKDESWPAIREAAAETADPDRARE